MTYPVDYSLNAGSFGGMQQPPAFYLPGMQPGGQYAPSQGLSAPTADSGGSGAGGFKLGFNAPTFQMGLSGLNAIGNLWGAFEAQKLAREQFDFTKNTTNTNLNNSIKSYNTALGDRARARGFTEGQSASQIQSYVDQNRLSR